MVLWLLLVHILPVLILLVLELPLWFGLLLFCVIVYSLSSNWQRYVSRTHPQAITAVCLQLGSRCLLRLANGSEVEARLVDKAFVQPWLLIMYFRSTRQRRTYSLVLFPDMLDRDPFRRLRAAVMMNAGHVDAPG